MYTSKRLRPVPVPLLRFRQWALGATAIIFAAASLPPAYAAILNDATVTGTPPSGPDVTDTDSESVNVAPAGAALTVGKTAAAPADVVPIVPDGVIKGGDTIAYTFTVWNRGNVTMHNVVPTDAAHTFNGTAAGGTMGPFSPLSATLAPGASQVFTATYTLTDEDAFRAAGLVNGVSNTMSATGNMGSASGPVIPPANVTTEAGQSATALTTVPANPKVQVAKAATLNKVLPNAAVDAEVNDTITYVYTVTNVGNVPLSDVFVSDVHEPSEAHEITVTNPTIQDETPGTPIGPTIASSSDAPADDGVWSNLVANDVVTFTYVHTVGQDEFDSQ